MAGAHICWSSCTCSAILFSARWLSTVLHEESEKNQPGVSMVVGARGISGRTPFISMCVGFQTSCSSWDAQAVCALKERAELAKGVKYAELTGSLSAGNAYHRPMSTCGTSYSLFHIFSLCVNVCGP